MPWPRSGPVWPQIRNDQTSPTTNRRFTRINRTPIDSAYGRNATGPLSALNGPADPGPLGAPPPNPFQRNPLPLGSRYGYRGPVSYGQFKAKGFGGNKPIGQMAEPPPEPPKPQFGSESGPGILESWFNQRAAGIDAASQYATRRGLDSLNDRYAAAGMANSGAARQGDADLLANIEAQRAGQLDALAGGASGEHQRRLDSMFGQGTAIAGGQSGINTAYDIKAAGVQSDALSAALNYFLNKAGVDDKSRQQGLNNILGIWGAAAS